MNREPGVSLVDFLAGERALGLRRLHARGPGEEPADALTVGRLLRRELGSEEARAVAEQIELERRAWAKFDDPRPLLFDRVALEQASSPGIARAHAALFPCGASIADLGCGLGADSIAFARAGLRVLGIELNAHLARLASHNLAALGLSALVARADASTPPARVEFAFADPDRRHTGRRRPTLAGASPSIDSLLALLPRLAGLAIKASAAIPDAEIPHGAACDFLSESGTCKEALLTWGLGRSPGTRRAVITGTGETRLVERGDSAESVDRGDFVLDPDPALVRAGGVDEFAHEVGAARVYPGVDYLFSTRPVQSPWARSFRVLAQLPLRRRDVIGFLSPDPPSTIVVKSRGFDPDEQGWRRVIPIATSGPDRILVCFARGRSRIALVCAPHREDLSSIP